MCIKGGLATAALSDLLSTRDHGITTASTAIYLILRIEFYALLGRVMRRHGRECDDRPPGRFCLGVHDPAGIVPLYHDG